jgi:NAD(P)-dependent dehydrogenase (short-subunit alcohol dehydrogenase family)
VCTKRTAVVTGASSGIGAATACALARDAFNVAVTATRIDNLSKTMEDLKAIGVDALAVVLDLRSQSSIERAMAAVVDAFGRADVLINNAAGIPFRKAAVELTRMEWEEVMGINVAGTYFMTQQMGKHLIDARRPGCIVNIASTHGIIGVPQVSHYCVSKAAIIHMTKVLALEWAPHRIRVNAIAPAAVETPSRAKALSNPQRREPMLAQVPLGRFCTADEVAAAVRYLVADDAAYVTGQTLVLDGGLTAH